MTTNAGPPPHIFGATLVSEHGRVIASADHRLAPGTLVPLDGQVPCGTLPLAVVSAGSSR